MAVTPTPIYPQTIKTGTAQIATADTTTLKVLFSAGVNGSKIDNILISSTDTSSRDLQFVVTISAVDYVIGTLAVPLNTGFVNTVAMLNALNHTMLAGAYNNDINGNKYLNLASGAVLKVKALTTVTAAKVISVIAQGGDY